MFESNKNLTDERFHLVLESKTQQKKPVMPLLDPESDLSMSVVVMGADILRELILQSPIQVDELMELFVKRDNRRTEAHFYSSLEFLYTVGAIEHHKYHIILQKSSETL